MADYGAVPGVEPSDPETASGTQSFDIDDGRSGGEDGGRLGTFFGVFVPCISSMFGVMCTPEPVQLVGLWGVLAARATNKSLVRNCLLNSLIILLVPVIRRQYASRRFVTIVVAWLGRSACTVPGSGAGVVLALSGIGSS